MAVPIGRRWRFPSWAIAAVLWSIALTLSPAAQPVFTGTEIFPPQEFAARRAKVIDRIGDAVAILQGTTERPGEQPFRQNNQFFYLTGVAQPRAIVAIDGRSKRTTLFLQPYDERREQRMFGPGLHPGDDAARATGTDAVLPRDDVAGFVAALAREGRTIYTPFRPEVLGEASSPDAAALARANSQDPWDGRPTREEWEDYTQTAIDPSDDCTIWYVGDYLPKGSETYATRIGAFRLPGCPK